ncbi:low-specificity L-threonine aldolase [soil metagenome]
MNFTDLRSDTVTKPSKGMLDAMLNAAVGDDVYGEDPTVNELQKRCAELTGKEDALFVPTGVMGNQLAIKAHTIQGDEVIVESESHILNYETGAASIISNVQLLPVQGEMGIMYADQIKKVTRPNDYYFPVTRLICMENTHNRAGGIIIPIDLIKEICAFAKENNIKMHLDGARIFNSCVETGISIKEYSSYFDTINFCFSKGLGCPIGSILCGDKDTLIMAHKWRKIIGGGMRQAGFIAACALYALENNIDRLKEDNDKAKAFSKIISEIDWINIDPEMVQTNIVVFSSSKFTKEEILTKLADKGILLSSGSYDNIRAVFHLDVTMEETLRAGNTLQEL